MFKKIIFCLDWFFAGALTPMAIAYFMAGNTLYGALATTAAVADVGAALLSWDVFKKQ
jgi:hypothetical protein